MRGDPEVTKTMPPQSTHKESIVSTQIIASESTVPKPSHDPIEVGIMKYIMSLANAPFLHEPARTLQNCIVL